MAFHPFHFFRKRQKTFLAILTILAMFIFILTGFTGSIVDRFMGGGGAGRKDKTEVTKLYGNTVTVSDLDQVLRDRRMADAFMTQALSSSISGAGAKLKGLDAEAGDHVQQATQQLQFFLGRLPAASLLQFGIIPRTVQDLRSYQMKLLRDGKKEAASKVGRIAGFYSLVEWQLTHPGELYFGGGTAADDLLDFLVWRQQADRLNINLTDEDLRKAVNHEADSDVLSGDQVKDGEKVRLYVQARVRDAVPKEVLAALREEFRVRLAKEVLLGTASGARVAMGGGLAGDEVPAGGTPEEFWEYYKDNRTTLKVDFLKVPISQFTAQVKQEPTQQALDDLYRRYKNDEPSPDRHDPGFKVPRKVKVEWVAADPDAPHYRQAAEKALPLLNNTQALTLLTIVPAGVGTACSPVGVYASLALPSLTVPQYQFEYESYVKGVKSWWDASNVTPEGNNPYATGVHRPDTRAAVAGQLIGAAMTGATPWSVEGTLGGAIEIQLAEQKAREASMVLAGASPFPLGVAAQEAALANVRIPPLPAVRDDLAARIRDRIAPEMADAAIQAFVKDLEAKRINAKDAAEYVEKNANIEHGITGHEVMAEARDLATLADDPALAPLRRAEEGSVPFTPSRLRQFAEKFFTTMGPDGRPTQTQLYHPERFESVAKTPYYFWLTENEKPKPLQFPEAKPQVEAAWKFIQARKEARAAADHIIEEMKKRGEGIAADRFLKDKAEQLKAANPGAGYERFDLAGIARLIRPDAPFMATTQYQPYKFPETNIAYPRSDSVEELLKQLKQPGDATVITDRPERNYYVAVLEERQVPNEKDFFEVYEHAPRGVVSDSLWARFQAQNEQKYLDQVLRHLRKEATELLDDQGNYRIDPEVRRRLRGGPGED